MSRSLGSTVRQKRANAAHNYEAKGREMFLAGLPCPRYADKGKGHAMERGWQRARMAAQKDKA